MNRMSAAKIINLKKPGVYGDGNGLRLRITKTGKKSFIVIVKNILKSFSKKITFLLNNFKI